MPFHALIRTLAVALTAALMPLAGTKFFYAFISLSIAHNLLGTYYSRHRLRLVLSAPRSAIPALALLGLAAVGMACDWPHSLHLFGLHFVLSETYLLSSPLGTVPGARDLLLRRFALNAAAYFLLVGHMPVVNEVPRKLWLGLYLLAALAYAGRLWRMRAALERREWHDLAATDAVGAACVAYAALLPLGSAYAPPHHLVVVYHVLLWTLLPLPRLAAGGKAAVTGYAAATVLLTGGVYWLTPAVSGLWNRSIPELAHTMWLTAYAHIALSLVTSGHNPAWWTRLFREPTAGAVGLRPATA